MDGPARMLPTRRYPSFHTAISRAVAETKIPIRQEITSVSTGTTGAWIPSGVVRARLGYVPDDAPCDEGALALMLPPELTSALVEDLTTLQRLSPVTALDA